MITMMEEMMKRLGVDVAFFLKTIAESMTEIGKWGTMLLSIDLLLCFGIGTIGQMVTQSALDWRLGRKPGPLPCSAGIGASWC